MIFEGDVDFDDRILAPLRRSRFFRLATDDEIDRTHAIYAAGTRAHAAGGADVAAAGVDAEALVEAWRAACAPTRATVDGVYGALYRASGSVPRRVTGLSFLATLRAVLVAGEAFRARLPPDAARVVRTAFPWLEGRHEHIPPGYTPRLAFPDALVHFVGAPHPPPGAAAPDPLDDVRARWQLVAALNEVQQTVYSDSLATLFGIPELRLHAARERALARHYLGRWSPPATRALWRQTVIVLDALNAAVFEMACVQAPLALAARSLVGAALRGGEWRAFLDGLARPQRLPG